MNRLPDVHRIVAHTFSIVLLAIAAAAIGGPAAAQTAGAGNAPRIMVSLEEKHLWLIAGQDTLFDAPVAIGMNAAFEFEGRVFTFITPRGVRRVIGKEPDPVWTPPDWHYFERASQMSLEVVHLDMSSRIMMQDSTFIAVQDGQVGRINTYGNFWPFSQGYDLVFYGTIYVPPIGTPQRRVPDALGPYKLDTGDGYLIHGTNPYTEDSIGQAVSHGCIRLDNADLERLYPLVPVGTEVHIF
jgi:hypothetical protein